MRLKEDYCPFSMVVVNWHFEYAIRKEIVRLTLDENILIPTREVVFDR